KERVVLKKNLIILTGAGVSAESGLKTFRDSDGLWMGYDVYEVASPQGWQKNPELVLDFYNQRRKEVAEALQLRPHVVWFGEQVPMIEKAASILPKADIFMLVGTSLQVYPAAGLIDLLPAGIPKYIIDKNPPSVPAEHNFIIIEKPATTGVEEVKKLIS